MCKPLLRSTFFVLGLLALLFYRTIPVSAAQVAIVSASDGQNSIHADRLIDGVTGTQGSVSWRNPNPWQAEYYPMTAVLDLGALYDLSSLEYFVGEINLGSDSIGFEYTANDTPTGFLPLVTVSSGNLWGQWTSVALAGQQARFVRLRFDSMWARFYVSEVHLFADRGGTGGGGTRADLSISKTDGVATYTDGGQTTYTITVSNNGPDAADGASIVDSLPASLSGATWTCAASGGATCGVSSGSGNLAQTASLFPSGGSLVYQLTATVIAGTVGVVTNTATVSVPAGVTDPDLTNNSASDSNAAMGTPPASGQPQSGPPGPGVPLATGFGVWPTYDLIPYCVALHDSYWTLGPDGKAYHTWHPAIDLTHPDPVTGTVCDFGHEHGNNPFKSPLFAESGGWPPFGYAAESAVDENGVSFELYCAHLPPGSCQRHEDHVGHKVTVAHYRAAFGNGGNTGSTLRDAGFDCDWLSKIHQGSYTMDAFMNHLHEYFLTVRCQDGDSPQTSTAFSIKVLYTYGLPNQFKDIQGAQGGTVISDAASILDPNGIPLGSVVMHTQTVPINPRGEHNDREFRSPNGFVWAFMDDVSQVDLWTELISIDTGGGYLDIQPYYGTKNPARVYNGNTIAYPYTGRVVRTIDLCYDLNDPTVKLDRKYCEDAPPTKPADWTDASSPFNGTLRSVNFKKLFLANEGGMDVFCTDAYGYHAHAEPCQAGEIRQTANVINNGWQGGQDGPTDDKYWLDSAGNKHFDEIAGSIPAGAVPIPGTNPPEYVAPGLGFEWIVDNRDPDDDCDGIPDGAHIRGQN